MSGRIKIDELISAELTLDDVNEAFELMHGGEVIRSIIKYT
jgi:S-(hydroxymethyl)glutathione dehydrogenase/alcohol dehydrogenase